jgi:hypothetical protein
MTCIYLGPPTDRRVTVSCPQIDGRPPRQETEHDCCHPERQRQGRRGSRPGRCLPAWPGPWKLPQQQADAAVLTLCATCPLRSS